MPAIPFFRLGKRVGDAFTDLYFQLPEEKQRAWDRERVAHHGALGYLAAAGALAGLAASERGRKRSGRVMSAALAFSLGLAESDAHDKKWWWSEGRLFERERERDPQP